MIQFMHEHKSLYGEAQTTVTYTSHDSSLPEIIEDFRKFLLAVGYQPETLKDYLGDPE